ncbi:Adhesin biosynthesis transcription regulatory protein [compost metagenome]
MKRLLQGGESAERFDLLLSLTNIRSEGIREALRDHLVVGHSVQTAAQIAGAPQPNVKRALVVLELVADTVEKIKDLDWHRLK